MPLKQQERERSETAVAKDVGGRVLGGAILGLRRQKDSVAETLSLRCWNTLCIIIHIYIRSFVHTACM